MLERFKKRPKIEFFTQVETLPEVVPVEHGVRKMPAWWKQMPGTMPNQDPRLNTGTAKICPAFPDFYASGYIVPLWCDVYFEFDHGKFRARTSAPDLFSISFHSAEQFLQFAPVSVQQSTVAVLKLNSPWYLRTSPGYSVYQLPVFYEFDPRFTTMMGVIRTDTHHSINQQLMIHEAKNFMLERGTPIAMYIPYRRERFKFEVKEVTKEFTRAMQKSQLNLLTKFRRGYRNYADS